MMKKSWIAVLLSVVLTFTLTLFPVYALDLNPSFSVGAIHNKRALAGEPEPVYTTSVTTQCPGCGRSTFVLRCSNFPVGYEDDVDCSISSHGTCVITNRMAYKTYGTCSSCTYGASTTVNCGTHIETCHHTGTGETYNTCYY